MRRRPVWCALAGRAAADPNGADLAIGEVHTRDRVTADANVELLANFGFDCEPPDDNGSV